jgi:hypothetical protein
MQELESGSGLVTKQKWMEKKCVKNYDLGAVTDANFIQCEKLQKKESDMALAYCNPTVSAADTFVGRAITSTDSIGRCTWYIAHRLLS